MKVINEEPSYRLEHSDDEKTYTSHSRLQEIKRTLLGQPSFTGGETYFGFGSYVHAADLEDQVSNVTFSKQEWINIEGCLHALQVCTIWQRFKKESVFEETHFGKVFGYEMKGILDVYKKKKYVVDLKTTRCRTSAQFIQAAIKYGYLHQGLVYKKLAKVPEVYFLAVQKEKPYNIFTLRLNDYDLHYTEQELKFLLWYRNRYGTPIETREIDNKRIIVFYNNINQITAFQKSGKTIQVKDYNIQKAWNKIKSL